MLDTVFYAVDIETKKKQLLHQLGDLKLSPAVDDRIRKQVKVEAEYEHCPTSNLSCPPTKRPNQYRAIVHSS